MSVHDALTMMAFDYGRRRIGVAVGQTVSRTATALTVLKVQGGALPWQRVSALVEEWAPDGFVVGLPQHDDGTVHTLNDEITRFGRRLGGRFARPVHYIDEYLSSRAAAASGDVAMLDAHAARVILETWFAHSSARAEVLAR